MNQIITIDGPAGAGKSTVSRLLAKKLDFIYLDTGAMYRAVALHARRNGISFENGKALHAMCKKIDINFVPNGDYSRIYIGTEDISGEIRKPEMDMLSSKISIIKEVRDAMTELQRKIGRGARIVAEGRDMGTVVFPEANHKFFLTASPEVRAGRRHVERQDRGESVTREDVEAEIRKRDEQDETRPFAPLKPAEDAIIIDSTELGINQVIEKILVNIRKKEVQL